MAQQSSRDAALARRMALSSGGKTAEKRFSSSAGRVRSAHEARPSRTITPAVVVSVASPKPTHSFHLAAPSHNMSRNRISNPSRDLALARREALSRRGKRAEISSDRTRSDLAKQAEKAVVTPVRNAVVEAAPASIFSTPTPSTNTRSNAQQPLRRHSQHNPSRALVIARREALAKGGKSANTSQASGTAAVMRQSNPDISSRELALKIRELRSKTGAAAITRAKGNGSSSSSRPSGPNRHGSKQTAADDATWKVGVSETLAGQTVTGTQANRSIKTTGNEAATCRAITGTEYLGAEVFQTFCQTKPASQQPAKVRVSATSHGNRVTGNEVGRSEKVTGDEPGTCKSVTGTEYISANQSAAYCGTTTPSVRKVGRSHTLGGQAVSGVMVGRSEKVTGDESGSGLQLTGDQYLGHEPPVGGRAATKVSSLSTLRGTGITGTHVGRSDKVTGDEPGTCRLVTGDEYVGSQQYERFCGSSPTPESAKVGFSLTNRSQVVSGTYTGRSEKVTGDEPGTCKIVTGTPYIGMEQAGNFCSPSAAAGIKARTPRNSASPLTGLQPGIGGVMTGAERGACENVTGTPYVGADQLQGACGIKTGAEPDFPQPLAGTNWQRFSVQSPARSAQEQRQKGGAVTGSTYEQGGRITGPFDMASGKVTGTEQFRFDRIPAPSRAVVSAKTGATAQVAAEQEPVSRVTGEGSGHKITGDDWDRGKRVTGTEGPSARRRNPSRVGIQNSMAAMQQKRNEDVVVPTCRVTGSSGSTDKGSLVTVSGGARG